MITAESPIPLPFLEGYSIIEWPDLTCDRHPSSDNYTTSKPLDNFSVQSHGSLLLAAISRIFGAYCSATDVLLAVQPPDNSNYTFVRVSWTDSESWQGVATRISTQPSRSAKARTSLGDIRRVFELPDKHHPCPILVQFTRSEEPSPNFPATFTFDTNNSSLTLSAPKTLLHPSINDQILAQVVFLFQHAAHNLNSIMASNPPFPPNLMSIFARLPEEEMSCAYPHMPTVSFATEYLGRRAKLNPNDIAVKWFPELAIDDPSLLSEAITYADLDLRATQVARWLVSRGLSQEDRVAVCLDRDITFHAAFVGIMRAGGCYVPIDPELPLERKAYIARDSGAKFVLTTSNLSTPDLFGPSSIYIDTPGVSRDIERQSGDDFNLATPDGLGYMLYTSGTTGNPKGCLLTNQGLAQAILALSSTAADVRMKDLSQGRYLAVASIAFDVHLAETLVPMALGMPLLSTPRSQLLENLPYHVKALGVTHLGIVPSLIEATLNASKDEDGTLALRYIASGGEKMSDSILDKWANHPQVRLANFYGPSEVTIGCCARYMSSSTPRANIGKPLANVSAYVVDTDLNILPRGGVGELVVEGPLVGRGYHGRPDLTKKVFLEWPTRGCWAYRTGDLVRMMPDSTLEILGRIDTQIKVRGVRIESEGISAIIRKAIQPSAETVLDATTVLAKHPALGNEQLVSFVTWDSSASVAIRRSQRPSLATPPPGLIKSIRSICKAELASYMRPNHIIPLNWLPLSSNGKIDAKILVDIFKHLDIADLASLISEDRNPISRACTQQEFNVFEVLKRHTPSYAQQPHPEVSIFECGLDSMGVIRFASDLRTRFGKSVSATDIMKKPCLEDISRLIDTALPQSSSVALALEAIDPESRDYVHSLYPPNSIESILPTFPVQEGVLARSVEDSNLYVQHVILRLEDTVSISSRLRESWEAITKTHPILRTIFYVDRSAWQVVLGCFPFGSIWSDHVLDVNTEGEFSRRFSASFASDVTKSINENLATIPPLRINTFTCNGLKTLVLSIHHTLYDGTSLPVLLQDVERQYFGLERVPTASLATILSEIAKQDLGSAQKFWVDTFRDFVWPKPYFDKPSSELSEPAKYLSVPFDLKLSQVKEIANKKQVTLQAFLSFIFAYLAGLHLYRTDDVPFGVIRSGRMLAVENIDYATCPTIAVLPMRVKLGDVDSTLANIQHTISAMTEHEHVPLGKAQAWLRPGEPLFETLFSLSVHQPDESKMWHSCKYEPPAADYPLSVEAVVDVRGDSLTVRAAWIADQISETLVTSLLKQFEHIANALDRNEVLPSAPSKNGPGFQPKETVEYSDEKARTVDPATIGELRQTICEFLQIPSVVLTDSSPFLSLGLDSIKAVGLAKRIRKLGYTVSSAEILKASTLGLLARVVTDNKEKSQTPSELYLQRLRQTEARVPKSGVVYSPEDNVQIYPATALQSGMLSQTVGSDGRLYIHVFPLALSIGIDASRLKAAWEETTKLVDILRTSFHFIPETGQWAQAVHSTTPLKWSTQVLDDVANVASIVHAFVNEIECADEFAFSSPPIWLRLFTSSTGTPSTLALVMHHALYDGISVGRLLNLVQTLYLGQEASYTHQFSDLLPDFFRQELQGTQFWEKQLAGLQPSLLPIHPHQGSLPCNKLVREIAVPSQVISNLIKTSEVTLQCLLQAALATSLADLTHSRDIVFGHVVSGRGSDASEDVIGPVLNTVPCRVTLREQASFTELLQSIHRYNMNTSSWHQASLRTIQKALKVDRLWDCLFTFQPLEALEEVPTIWSIHSGDEEDIHIQYPLHIEVEHTSTGFSLRCACRGDVLDQEALSQFVGSMARVINFFVANPNEPLSRRTAFAESIDKPASISSTTPTTPSTTTRERNPAQSAEIPPALLAVIRFFAPTADISIDTPLPALGIDSITAIQISGKCRRAGLRLSATQILNSNTVKDLVLVAKDLNAPEDVPTASTKQPEGAFEPLPLSSEEKESISRRFGSDARYIEHISRTTAGMNWPIGGWQRSNGSQFQHVFTFKLPDDIDLARFKNSWHMFIRRHEILRSTFATAPGGKEPRLVTFSKDFKFDHWVEEAVDDAVFYRSLLVRMKETVSNPLPISRPPIRARVFRSTKQTYFILHIHHFQYDAWSMQVLLNDLSSIYYVREPWAVVDLRSFTALSDPNEKRLGIQRKFWQSSLSTSFKPALFPSLLHEAKESERLSKPSGQPQSVIVPSALTSVSRYEARARALGVRLHTVLLAAWAQVQATRSKGSETTFGVWQVGRSGHVEGIERLAVPCVNVLPMHVKVGGSTLDVTNRIQQDLSTRSSEADIELSDLVDVSKWVGMSGDKPIFNANVNVVKVPTTLMREGLFEPVKAPHCIPEVSIPTITPTLDRLTVSTLAPHDVMVDIVLDEKSDSVFMSIEVLDTIMTAGQAKEIIREWASIVDNTLKYV